MPSFLRLLDDTFLPHGHCFFWKSDILWLHVLSDSAIALSYFFIPFALVQLIRKRKDLIFDWMFLLFGLFILLCGLTHVMDIVVLWDPYYRLQGFIKLATAMASIPTALLLIRLVPRALEVPSIAAYQQAAEALKAEISRRELAEQELRHANALLESRVAERTAELHRSENVFRTLAETVPQLVWSARSDGYHDYFNNRWVQFAGMSRDDRQGQGWSVLVHPDERDAVEKAWAHSMETGEGFEGEYRFRDASLGRYRWFLCRANALRDENNQITRWVGTCTDIDEQKRNAQSLMRANQDLEQFAYAASHDLQEPLRTILVYAQLMQRDAERLDSAGRSALANIVQGANRMASLLLSLRAYLRSAQGASDERTPVSCDEVLADVLDDLKAARDESEVIITADKLPMLLSDRWRIAQLFLNLISNAIKYRGQISPQVHVGVDTSAPIWTFYVKDNGEGIEPEHLGSVFKPFRRLHSRRKPGSGLGLAISERIVQIYGGRIWVESQFGVGSIFYFTLPEAQPPQA